MKIFKTIFLGTLIVLMYAYYFFYEADKLNEMQKAREDAKKVFLELKPEAIKRIAVKGDKGEVSLSMEGGSWALKSPVEAEVDIKEVESFIKALAGFRLNAVITKEADDYEEFGLKSPKIKIDFTAAGGEKSLLIGSDTPTGDMVYGKVGTEPMVFAFSQSLKKRVNKGPYDFRDKTALSLKKEAIRRLSITGGGKIFQASLTESGLWQAKSPFKWRADKEKIDEIIAAVLRSRITKFVAERPEDLSEYGLDKPNKLLKFFYGKEDKVGRGLLIGAKIEGRERYYTMREGGKNVFLTDWTITKKIPDDLMTLRDARLLPIGLGDKIVKLNYSGEEKIQIAKQGDGEWLFLDPEGLRADLFMANQWAEKIAEAKVKVFLNASKVRGSPEFGLATPMLSVAVWEKGAKEPRTILIGNELKGGKGYYAALAGGPEVFILSDQTVRDMTVTVMKLRDRKLVDFDTEEIKRAEIVQGGKKVELVRSGNEWTANPSGKKVKAGRVRSWLWDIVDLTFDNIAAHTDKADPAQYGLDKPLLSIKLFKDKGEPAGDIRFGLAVPLRSEPKNNEEQGVDTSSPLRYVLVNGHGDIFEVKTMLVDEIKTMLNDWRTD